MVGAAAAGGRNSGSRAATSRIQDRSLTVLRLLFAAGIPLTIVNISFAAAYAWIYSNQVG